jgi:hypothetical protein
MPLFRRHRDATDEEDPAEGSSFDTVGAAAGFEPASGDVFDDELESALRETARVEHGVSAQGIAQGGNLPRSYRLAFEHVFRADRDGRRILLANAVFHPNPGLVGSRVGLRRVAVCVVELPSAMALGAVQPRSYRHEILRHWPESPTGNPAFDERFRVCAGRFGGPFELPAAVQGLVMARDDWIFRVQVTWFICVTPEPFSSIDEMVQRVDQVMAIVAAFPTTMLAARIDHSGEDLLRRLGELHSVEDAIAFLGEVTPAEREQLAQSDTPLAAFADVTTPDQIIERFQSLDQAQQLQLLAMFEHATGDA